MKPIFIHLPRTGGSFMRKVFESYHVPNHDHGTIEELDNADTYFKFGFIRNPFDWYVSRYFYYRQYPNSAEKGISKGFDLGIKHDAFFDKIHSVNTHIQIGINIDGFFLGDIYNKMYKVNGELKLDYIARFENMEQEIRTILEMTEKPTENLDTVLQQFQSKKNSTERKHYKYYFSQDAKNVILKKDKELFDTYRYEW